MPALPSTAAVAPLATDGAELAAALLGGALLLGVGAGLAPIAQDFVRRLVPERRVFFARWGFSDLALVVATGFVLVFLTGAAREALGLAGTLVGLYQMLIVMGGVGLVCASVARRVEPEGWRALGLRSGGGPRALAAAAVGFVFVLPAVFGAQLAWPALQELAGGEWSEQPVALGIRSLSGGALAQAVFLAIVVQPFLEELFFRGFVQPLLVQNLSERLGIVLTSVLFGLVHGLDAFGPVFVLSLAIGNIMLRTQRLSAAWLVHALNNGLFLTLMLTA